MGQPCGARRAALAAGFVVAATGLSLARQAGAGALDTVYAEDGTIFLADAYGKSTLDALATPYAGYLHAVPRLVAELVSPLPIPAAAAGLAIAAAIVTGLLALLVYEASGSVLRSRWARGIAAAVVVLVPVGQDEIPNSIANLHWPMLYALFWVLLWRPGQRWVKPIKPAVVLLIALSDILTVVFLPLALWQWARRRDHATLAAYGAGLAAQAAAVMFGHGERALQPEPVMWAPWWVIRAVPTGLLGERWFGGAGVDKRWLILAAVTWLVVAGLVFLGLRGERPQALWVAALAAVYCVAVYALPVALSGQATSRYAAAPAMLLVAALAVLLFEGAPKRVGWAFLALCLVVWAVNLRVPNSRATGPSWSDELSAGRCSDRSMTVTVAPRERDWRMAVPC
jgi:hypothetical protein